MAFSKKDFFPSRFFKATEFAEALTLTITEIKSELVGPEKALKCVVSFAEDDRGLPLNATNWSSLEESYGDNTDSWVGERIRLQRSKTQFGGKTVPCLRVKPLVDGNGNGGSTPPPATPTAKPAPPKARSVSELEDDFASGEDGYDENQPEAAEV